jgi:hypothetical protein
VLAVDGGMLLELVSDKDLLGNDCGVRLLSILEGER